ncbi:pantoate--beta-alanine ligase [soil metagenome]
MVTNPDPLPIVRTVEGLRSQVRDWRRHGLSVALVPTMGALHEGHLSLVAEALSQADRVVTSVFVNPTQFAAHEDLGTYPRREARDAELLAGAGCAVMYAPTVAEMYPAGFVTTVSVGDAETGGPSQGLEGAARPQMFGGVALVVSKLLNQVQADVAVFGEKDWQQLRVVRRMVADLDIPTRIVGVATSRDGHGLALSSRNAYLSEDELEVARALNGVLAEAASKASAGGSVADLEQAASAALIAAGFDRVDYVAIRRADDLSVFETNLIEGPARILAAAVVGRTRLIDNMAVPSGG